MKKHILNALILFIGLFGISLLVMFTTPFGLPAAMRIVSSVVPGELTISGYSGRLIDSIHADNITYQNDRVNVTLKEVTLKWDAMKLLTRTLYIEHLEAKDVLIQPLSSFEEDAGFTLDLALFSSDNLNVIVDKYQLHFQETDISGSLALNEHGLRLRKVRLEHPLVNMKLQANIGPDFNPPIKIIATESFTLEGVNPISAETRLIGNLDKLEGSQIFTEGLNAQLHIIAQHIGPAFTLTASGETDLPDLQSYSRHLVGKMHVNLNLQYEHATGAGKVSLQSKNSVVNGTPFKMDFSGNIQDYVVSWKNNAFIFGEDRLLTSGAYGPDTLHLDWDLQAKHLDTLLQSRGVIKKIDTETLLTTLKTLSVTFPDQTIYALKKPASFQLTPEHIRIQANTCLTGPQDASLCAENIDDNVIAFHAKHIPHELIARYFTPRFTITGYSDLKALLKLNALKFEQLDINATLTPLEVIRGKRKPHTLFKTGAGSFDLMINNKTLSSTGHLGFINPDRLDWNINVQDWNDLSLADLTAEFKGNMSQWDPLRLFITDTNDFSGEVTLDIKAKGPVLEPTYSGALLLNNARLAIPSRGLILQEGKLVIAPGNTPNDLHVEGGVRSGDGVLKLTGNLSLKDRWPAFDLAIAGDNFLLSNTTAAVVYASPRLRIVTHDSRLDLTGEIHIPEANLNIKGYRSYISPSPDIILLEDAPPVRSFIYDVNTRVMLSLGKKISLKASQLDTGVEGQLEFVKYGDDPVRATGQLYGVNGKYAAYGKKLNINKAVLSFNNTLLDNPSLFIEASRTVQISQLSNSPYMFTDPSPQSQVAMQEGSVGLRITGTVQNPKYTFYSNPPMSEADQLSYLLTGAPSSQVGAAQAAFMFAALTETSGMLGVSDTDAARLKNITRTMGIDFNIESGSHYDSTTGERVNDTNLVVGKAIRPRLYVSYTVGLLDPLNVFRVRYQLSRHWAAQSQANSQGDTGGDILYGIESDAFLGMD